MTKTLSVFLLILSVALASCNIKNKNQVKKYKGYYWYGSEQTRFSRMCRNDRWWMRKNLKEVTNLIMKNINNPDTQKSVLPIYIEVEGKLSSKGEWGHLGGSSRILEVSKVLFFSKTGKRHYKGRCEPASY